MASPASPLLPETLLLRSDGSGRRLLSALRGWAEDQVGSVRHEGDRPSLAQLGALRVFIPVQELYPFSLLYSMGPSCPGFDGY